MNNYTRFICISFILLLLLFCFNTYIFATGTDVEPLQPWVSGDPNASAISGIDDTVDRVWGTITVVVQVLAFIGIIFVGLRYMFASADKKSDIKGSLIFIILGIILIFAAGPLVKIVHKLAEQILKI